MSSRKSHWFPMVIIVFLFILMLATFHGAGKRTRAAEARHQSLQGPNER